MDNSEPVDNSTTGRANPGPIRRALLASLRATTVDPRDQATVALAKRLATLLDEAAPKSSYTEPLLSLERLARAEGDEDDQRAFRRVMDALGEHSVASDLGPKYLAALTALGLTPAARGVKGPAPAPAGPTQLDELRAKAAARRRQSASP